VKFSELQLHPVLQANLDKIGFTECTKIQDEGIPWIRKGKDVAGLAQTGTGKTGAFLIPLIDRLLKAMQPEGLASETETVPFNEWKKKQYCLILVPTRELAEQVQENAQRFLENTGMRSVSIYGGTSYEKQIEALKEGVEFVIATPGRLIDLYKEHLADLGLVRAVVFDEADRMFDMGFKDDMKFILKRIPRDRQFLVFSATLNFDVLNTGYEFGADPVEINISRDQAKAENVKDSIFHVGQDEKPKYLLSLLKKHEPRQTIIFSNFKHNVERIARFLTSNGVPAVGISSLLTQAQRNRVMEQFKADNDRNIMVATDLAARGLDILGVDMVMNFDLPDDPENYVHRIGRTGRAGQTGQAFSLVSDRDVEALQRIEEYLKHKVESLWLEESELVQTYEPFPRDEGRGGGGRGPRREGAGGGGRGGRDRGGDRGGRGRDRGGDRDRNRDRNRGGEREARGGQGAGGEHRDRNRGRDRDRQPRGAGEHRDRQSGRHQQNAGGGNGPQPANGPRRELRSAAGREQQQRGGNPRPGGRHGGGGRGQQPRHQQRRGAAPAGVVANKSLGQKVSGFFKKLFGGE